MQQTLQAGALAAKRRAVFTCIAAVLNGKLRICFLKEMGNIKGARSTKWKCTHWLTAFGYVSRPFLEGDLVT